MTLRPVSLQAVILLVGCFLAQPLWASCSFSDGTSAGQLLFTLPPITVPQDTTVGTVLYSGQASAGTVKIDCNANGAVYQGYTSGISDSDYQSTNPLEGVYATNIPGVGLRATWVNDGTASFSGGSYISPWHIGSSTVSKKDGTYYPAFKALFQLVVTGPISSGTLDTSRLIADWQYDNLVVAKLRFTSTTVNVKANTCNLVEKNILVPLKTISTESFVGDISEVVSDDNFRIQLTDCSEGMLVDLKFTSAGSSGVSYGNILNIDSGDNAAQGVGIQIRDMNDQPLAFDQLYVVNGKTNAGDSADIPLKARYVRTGTVKAGEVHAVATFEVSYR